MKTSGTTDAVLPLTKKQKCVCNLVMGALLVAAGVILALAGGGIIHVSVRRIAAATILLAFGAGMLFSAVVAKNALSMWLSGVILSLGMCSLLEVVTTASYGNLFPIYIAAPGVGCMFAIIFAEAKLPQIKGMLFFGIFAALFSLASSGACGWGLACGLCAAFGGVCVIEYAAENYFKKDNN